MSEEGEKNDVVEIQPDKETGKYPEHVSWNQYVGIKESLGKKLDTERAKVTSLEEKAKIAVNPEELERVKTELAESKAAHEKTTTELNEFKESTLTEKRNALTKRGVPEEKVKEMSGKELDAAFVVLEYSKPGPDMGGGGGSGAALTGSPQELARQAYATK